MKVQRMAGALNMVSPITKEKTQRSSVLHPQSHFGSWEAGCEPYVEDPQGMRHVAR